MPVFIQLSKHQRKDHDRMARIFRNARRHQEQFPSQQDKLDQQKALENEVAHLAAEQAHDDDRLVPLEVVRYNNAVKAQDAYRKGVTIRRKVEVTP